MGCEPYLVSSAIIGVGAQRLVRRICAKCRKGYEPNATERNLLGIPPERTQVQIYRGEGCSRCGRSGYFDRVGLFEYVPFDTGLSQLVMEKASTETMQQYAINHGAVTLRMDGIAKVLRGLTTLEEALRVTAADTLGGSGQRSVAGRAQKGGRLRSAGRVASLSRLGLEGTGPGHHLRRRYKSGIATSRRHSVPGSGTGAACAKS
jgi:hypothetical protein